jgi:hypothetical protein
LGQGLIALLVTAGSSAQTRPSGPRDHWAETSSRLGSGLTDFRKVAIPIAQFGSLSIMEAIVHEKDGFRPGREPSAVRRVDMVPSDRRVTKLYRRLTGLANAEHGSATELAVSGLAGFTADLGCHRRRRRGVGGIPIDLVRAKPVHP